MAYRPKKKAGKKMYKKKVLKGKKADNTKVIEKATFSYVEGINSFTSATGVGQYILYGYSPVNTAYVNVNKQQEFIVQSKLFDEYCITGMKVTYIPTFNYVASTTLTTTSNGQMFSIVDRDGNAPIASSISVPVKLQAYTSCRRHHIAKTWSRFVKCNRFWMDTNNSTVNPAGASNGATQAWTNAGLTQSLSFYAEQLNSPATSQFGQARIEWFVEFRGKKPANYGYDPVSDSVIITPMTSLDLVPYLNVPSDDLSSVLGDVALHCDASGNINVVATSNSEIAYKDNIEPV